MKIKLNILSETLSFNSVFLNQEADSGAPRQAAVPYAPLCA